jgi:hypothetical protein
MLIRLPLSLTLAAVALVALSGCGSGQDRSTATTKATATVPGDATTATRELDRVLASLKGMRDAQDGADLKKLHSGLASHAAKLDACLIDVMESSEEAVIAGKKQIAAWHTQADAFTDADLRKASTRREDELRKSVDDLSTSRTALQTVGDAFRSQLAQTVNALDLDLSKRGVESVASIMAKIENDEPNLRKALADVGEKSTAVRRVISP